MAKDANTIKELISMGESYTLQFKREFVGQDRIADEMVAFANSKGGTIVIGVDDKTGDIIGLDYKDIQRISNEIGNAANEKIRPTIYVETEPQEIDGKHVLLANVSEGISKPYKNLRGEIYVKQGADKRRITENREILRLFHDSRQYFPDEEPVYGARPEDIYDKALDRFLQKGYGKSRNDFGIPLPTLLKNLRIVSDKEDQLTLSGFLFFAEHPERLRPQFIIKAVAFVGNSLGGSQYRDSRDIAGDMAYIYEEALRFCDGNLRHIQAGQSFNSLGILEVSRIALEELIQNALTHRSYLVDAPIRLLIFDDRIEIINPGALAGKLTVENIKLGEAYQRNPLLASLCARGMSYRGLGSGIVRALMDGADIEFVNNEETDTFKAILYRHTDQSAESGQKSCMKTEEGCKKTEESGQKSCMKTEEGCQKTDDNGQKSCMKTEGGGQKTDDNGQKSCMKTEEGCKKTEDYGSNGCMKGDNGCKKTTKGGQKTIDIILDLIDENSKITYRELSEKLGISIQAIQKHIENLKAKGIIKRVGPDKGGYWQILS